MGLSPELRNATFRWIADDCDPQTRRELQDVLARAMVGDDVANADLFERMTGTLSFGTAGLRGPVRAGSNGMNTAVVMRTTAGVARWLTARGNAGGTVVIGRDARHGSEGFASAVAGVFAAAGFDAATLPDPLPTPLLAYAVRQCGAVAGVQITASHNPASDNGYKLYLESGTQLIPPDDRHIESTIAGEPASVAIGRRARARTIDVYESYLDRVASLPRGTARELRIVLTPMHGVGGATCVDALRRAGFTDVAVVREQAVPDPDFPTVAFPNPEEPGAADLLLALAAERDADLAIALDPDADRCAIGVRDGEGWRMLRGDETGALLGDYVLRTNTHPDPLVATTIVSSSLLREIARNHGARYDETPTGFKWLVRAGDGAGTGLVFAYEEAIGTCVDPDAVRDKDGISAAVLAADLAASCKARQQSLPELLDGLYAEHGVHVTDQISLRVDDIAEIGRVMTRLRSTPPSTLGAVPVRVEDMMPTTSALRFTGDGLRVVVRPSGTEPKLKAYLQVVEPPAGKVEPAKDRAHERMVGLRSAVDELLGA